MPVARPDPRPPALDYSPRVASRPPVSPVTVAVDAGTTGVRALVVDERARVVDVAYGELTQYYPRPGWVEHDPTEIWDVVRATLAEVAGRLADQGRVARAIGITNQRETVVAWDRRTGRPAAPGHRLAGPPDRGRLSGHGRGRPPPPGPGADRAGPRPVLLGHQDAVAARVRAGCHPDGDLAFGTVDAWVLWNLTGGADGGVFATDATNASRTMLFDIVVRRWSAELCDLFGVPERRPPRGAAVLRPVRAGCRRRPSEPTPRSGACPISGMAGDQHAALFGQACFDPGMTKATIGTGSFVLMNAGPVAPAPVDGLITTLAWDLGDRRRTSPSAPTAGARVARSAARRWPTPWRARSSCRGPASSGCGTGSASSTTPRDMEPLARTVDSSEGVVVVPAFTGLGSPYWDPEARGTIVGLSRGTGRAHLARAMVEAMGFQVRDVVDAMAPPGRRPRSSGSTAGPRPWACCSSWSPTRPGSRWSGPRRSRPPPSVRPPWPDWPKGCGARSTTWPPCGPRTSAFGPWPRCPRPSRPTGVAPRRRPVPALGRAAAAAGRRLAGRPARRLGADRAGSGQARRQP